MDRNDRDELAEMVLRRLEAIERRLGLEGPGARDGCGPDDRRGPGGGPDRFGPRGWQGGYDGLRAGGQERDWRGRDEGGDECGGCRFNEKRTVDLVVQLITERLEEVLRVLPQVIQIESRPGQPQKQEPPAPPPPPGPPPGPQQR